MTRIPDKLVRGELQFFTSTYSLSGPSPPPPPPPPRHRQPGCPRTRCASSSSRDQRRGRWRAAPPGDWDHSPWRPGSAPAGDMVRLCLPDGGRWLCVTWMMSSLLMEAAPGWAGPASSSRTSCLMPPRRPALLYTTRCWPGVRGCGRCQCCTNHSSVFRSDQPNRAHLDPALGRDPVVRLHGAPEVAVRLQHRRVRPQRGRGARPRQLLAVEAVQRHGAAAARGVARPRAGREVEVLGAGPLAAVVGLLLVPGPAPQRRGRGRDGVLPPARQRRAAVRGRGLGRGTLPWKCFALPNN